MQEPDYSKTLISSPLSGAILGIIFLGCAPLSLLFAWALAFDIGAPLSIRLVGMLFAFMGAMLLRAALGAFLVALGQPAARLVSRPMALLFLGMVTVALLVTAGDSWMKHRSHDAIAELSCASGFLLFFVRAWRYLRR
jgi:hypothetical protein